jgi:hypothetical protein
MWQSIWSLAACEMKRDGPSGIGRHRAGEIVASQGGGSAPTAPIYPAPTSMSLEEYSTRARARNSRSSVAASSPYGGSFVGPPGAPGYPCQTPPQPSPSFNSSALGSHLAVTAAALGSEASVPGQGLYVSMQRGCNVREGRSKSFELPSGDSLYSLPRRPANIRSESPGRMIPASKYEGTPEDSIDEALAAECQRLPHSTAQALLIRRIAHGEYEVDGVPVRLSWDEADTPMQVVVLTLSSENARAEPLARFLPTAANAAFKKSSPEVEIPSFPWPLDLLSKTMPNPRKASLVLPAAPPAASPVSVSIEPPRPVGRTASRPPGGASMKLQAPTIVKAKAPMMSPSFVVPSPVPAGSHLPMRTPSMQIVPVPKPLPVQRPVKLMR